MSIFISAFAFVLIAEMGDKTQLFAVACASKYKAKDVMIGITTSIIILNAIAVIAGSYISQVIPIIYVKAAAAVSFIMFGLLSVKNDDEEEEANIAKNKYGPIITVALAFFVSEFGDKTQLMAITMSAQYMKPIPVFLGAVLGMVIADGLGVIGGSYIAKFVPQKYIRWGAAVIFLIFGSTSLYTVLNTIAPYLISPMYMVLYLLIIILLVFIIATVPKGKHRR